MIALLPSTSENWARSIEFAPWQGKSQLLDWMKVEIFQAKMLKLFDITVKMTIPNFVVSIWKKK